MKKITLNRLSIIMIFVGIYGIDFSEQMFFNFPFYFLIGIAIFTIIQNFKNKRRYNNGSY